MRTAPPLSLTEQIIAQARIAVAYHRVGYQSSADFDANVMVRLMDQLGEIIDDLDDNGAKTDA